MSEFSTSVYNVGHSSQARWGCLVQSVTLVGSNRARHWHHSLKEAFLGFLLAKQMDKAPDIWQESRG